MSSIIRIPSVHQTRRQKNGINIGFGCRVCTCLNLDFLKSRCAMLKICELVLGSCCETLLIRFGLPAAQDIGEAFFNFHSTVTACLMTTFLLLVSYFLSAKTFGLIRQSVFETFFNSFACFLYISASFYLGFSSNIPLQFYSSNAALPAMQSAYYIGGILGIVYGLDAYDAYSFSSK